MNRRVILCPNPTKDDGLETSRRAKAILEEAGFEVCICPEFVDGRPDDLPDSSVPELLHEQGRLSS